MYHNLLLDSLPPFTIIYSYTTFEMRQVARRKEALHSYLFLRKLLLRSIYPYATINIFIVLEVAKAIFANPFCITN